MRERIAAALRDADQTNDQTRLSTLRLITAAIKDREQHTRPETEESAIDEAVIRGLLLQMVAQRQESARVYEEAGRLELAEREREEIAIIEEFLPRPMTAVEISDAVADAVASTEAAGIRDVGRVMTRLKSLYPGRMDFNLAAATTRRVLSGGD